MREFLCGSDCWVFTDQGWRGSLEGSMSTVIRELHTPSAPSYTLHRFPEKQPGIFLGMCEQPSMLSASSVCLTSLALSLTPTFLAQLTEALSKHKHLSLEWQKGNLFISLTSSLFPLFLVYQLSLQGLLLFLDCPSFSPLPPSYPPTYLPISSKVSTLFVYLSHACFAVFSG